MIGIFGVLGNSISFLVLNVSTMRSSTFNVLLIVLISLDNIFIAYALLDYACIRGEQNKVLCPPHFTLCSVLLAPDPGQQYVRPAVPQGALPSQQRHHLLLHWTDRGHQY